MDQDGDALHVTNVGAPGHGTAALNPAGTAILYTPAAQFSGADSFGYSISDGAGGTDTAVVSVTVTPVDDPPTAEARTATTTSPNPVTITLRGTDIDSCELSFQVVDLPNHGGVGSLAGQACTAGSPNADTATVVYTPTAGYSGSDSFTYRVLDATGASAAATVSITINATQPPPPSTIHIGDLDGVGSAQGKTWTAKVTIHVHKANETAAAGTVVTGTWSNGASGTSSCTTSGTGTCSVQVSKLAATVASATFTVTGVTLANSTYTPASNHDPDGGNGTTIIVTRPF
jgi:hypothetical protein